MVQWVKDQVSLQQCESLLWCVVQVLSLARELLHAACSAKKKKKKKKKIKKKKHYLRPFGFNNKHLPLTVLEVGILRSG